MMAVIMEGSACFPPQVAMQTGQALCLAFLFGLFIQEPKQVNLGKVDQAGN